MPTSVDLVSESQDLVGIAGTFADLSPIIPSSEVQKLETQPSTQTRILADRMGVQGMQWTSKNPIPDTVQMKKHFKPRKSARLPFHQPFAAATCVNHILLNMMFNS